MRTAEKILFGIALIGLLFKIQHWPFASVVLILSLSALVILYSQLATRWFGDPTRQDQLIWFSRLSGIGLGIVVLGMLFTIQQWPNGKLFLLIGAMVCAVSAVLSLVLRKDRPELAAYFRGILWRVSIFGGLGALLLYGQGLKNEARPLEQESGTVDVVQPPTERADRVVYFALNIDIHDMDDVRKRRR